MSTLVVEKDGEAEVPILGSRLEDSRDSLHCDPNLEMPISKSRQQVPVQHPRTLVSGLSPHTYLATTDISYAIDLLLCPDPF